MEIPMVAKKKHPSLKMLLCRYDFSIDYTVSRNVTVEESDILLSAIGLIDKSNYLYVVRPAEKDEDWKIYRMKNKRLGHLPSEQVNYKPNIKAIVKRIKELTEPA